MPSYEHEVPADMFRFRPELAATVLTDVFGLRLPEYQDVRVEPADVPILEPTEYRADRVITLTSGNVPRLAVVIEIQLRPDAHKRLTWPVYVTALRARLKCPVVLLVLCPSDRVARWCAEPIEVGPGFILTPFAMGPRQVPVVTDPAQATQLPELSVLSAIAHAGQPVQDAVFTALASALTSAAAADTATIEQYRRYYDFVLSVLPAAARHHLEEIMTTTEYTFHSEFAQENYSRGLIEGEAKGEAKGEANALLAILAARGLPVTEAVRDRITTCDDSSQLSTWITAAITVERAEDLFT